MIILIYLIYIFTNKERLNYLKYGDDKNTKPTPGINSK